MHICSTSTHHIKPNVSGSLVYERNLFMYKFLEIYPLPSQVFWITFTQFLVLCSWLYANRPLNYHGPQGFAHPQEVKNSAGSMFERAALSGLFPENQDLAV